MIIQEDRCLIAVLLSRIKILKVMNKTINSIGIEIPLAVWSKGCFGDKIWRQICVAVDEDVRYQILENIRDVITLEINKFAPSKRYLF